MDQSLCLQRADQLEAGLQSLCTLLPAGGADLVPVFTHELAGLKLSEQLLGVSADITRVHLIGDDSAIRVYDKAAALCDALIFDQHLEVPAECVGRVRQHRVAES